MAGWLDSSQSLNVTVELLRRGFREEEIRKLWGGNFLRVWQAAMDGGENAEQSVREKSE